MDSTSITAWDTSCITASSADREYMTTSLGLASNLETAVRDKVFYYHRGIVVKEGQGGKDDNAGRRPVLVLLHGYPQTSFMWRHIISLLPKDIPLFVPDLPGYGRSSPLPIPHSKRNVGNALLSTLYSLLPQSATPYPLILAGHDRGARVSHRLAVDAPKNPHFIIQGAILLDIMPGPVQWQKASTPSSIISFYHWAFLPNVDLATAMISAFGGDKYTLSNLARWKGQNETGITKLQENDAENVYAQAFKYEHVIRATCDDYRASAEEELGEHEDDQKAGRKVDCDVLVLYSDAFLGSRGKIEVWQDWVGEKGTLETRGIGGGTGHFLAEEAPEETAEKMLAFYRAHV